MDDLSRYRSVPGEVICLSCQTPFQSPDRVRIRRCEPCKKGDSKFGVVLEQTKRLAGGTAEPPAE